MPQARFFFKASKPTPRRGFTGAQCLLALRALSKAQLGLEHLEAPRALLFFEKGTLDASFSLSVPVDAALSAASLVLSMPPGSSASVKTDLGLLQVKHSLAGQLALIPQASMEELISDAAKLPPGMATWLMLGRRTPSSDILANSLFGVPETSGTALPATLGDVRSCMELIDATRPSNIRASMAEISGQWALISSSWDDLTEIAGAASTPTQASQCAQRIQCALSGEASPQMRAKPVAPKSRLA